MIKMETLRGLYESLGLRGVASYVNSGNVVFRTGVRDLAALGRRIEGAIETRFGFRPSVILRTAQEMKDAMARNPFAGRAGVEPGKLIVTFLADAPSAEAREKALGLRTLPDELHIDGREMYAYFPNGMGGSKMPFAAIERALKTPGTGRNWNTVTKLLEMAEKD